MKSGHKICKIDEKIQVSPACLKGLRHETWLYRLLNSWIAPLYKNLLDEDFNRHEGSIEWYYTAFSVMFAEINHIRTQRDKWKLLAVLFMLGFLAICSVFIFYALNCH